MNGEWQRLPVETAEQEQQNVLLFPEQFTKLNMFIIWIMLLCFSITPAIFDYTLTLNVASSYSAIIGFFIALFAFFGLFLLIECVKVSSWDSFTSMVIHYLMGPSRSFVLIVISAQIFFLILKLMMNFLATFQSFVAILGGNDKSPFYITIADVIICISIFFLSLVVDSFPKHRFTSFVFFSALCFIFLNEIIVLCLERTSYGPVELINSSWPRSFWNALYFTQLNSAFCIVPFFIDVVAYVKRGTLYRTMEVACVFSASSFGFHTIIAFLCLLLASYVDQNKPSNWTSSFAPSVIITEISLMIMQLASILMLLWPLHEMAALFTPFVKRISPKWQRSSTGLFACICGALLGFNWKIGQVFTLLNSGVLMPFVMYGIPALLSFKVMKKAGHLIKMLRILCLVWYAIESICGIIHLEAAFRKH